MKAKEATKVTEDSLFIPKLVAGYMPVYRQVEEREFKALQDAMFKAPAEIKARLDAAFSSDNYQYAQQVVKAACSVLKCTPETVGIAAQAVHAIASAQ